MATRGAARLLGSVRSRALPLRGIHTPGSARVGAYAGTLAFGGAALWLTSEYYDDIDLRRFRRAFVLHADAASQPDFPSKGSEGAVRVDPDTSVQFPVKLNLTTLTPPLTLVGLGVRTVSFLRMKVYSAGFYLEESQAKSLDSIDGWHTFTAQHLLTAPTTKPSDPLDAPQLSGEALMRILLDRPIACAVRIVPVRNTDFSHLRDGFTRAIAARQKLARSAGKLTEETEVKIAESTQVIKSIFPAHSAPKGKALTLLRTSTGSLVFEYEGKVLGQVDDPWVSKEMMLAYFADKDVISSKLKEDVARGLEAFIKH